MKPSRTEKATARKWFYPPRSLNQIMTVVALSGLALTSVAPRGGVLPWGPRRPATPPRVWRAFPTPAQAPTGDDRFTVVASEGLDPRFVVAAPEGIDEGMIVSRGGRAPVAEGQPVAPQYWTIPIPLPPGR